MSSSNAPRPEPEGYRPLHPLPRGLVELYGFLAVLVVLIPEWMASGALQKLLGQPGDAALPAQTRAWRKIPELRLASMSMAELRLLARQMGLRGYSSLGRDRLSARLLVASRRQRRLDPDAGSRPLGGYGGRRLSLSAAVVLLLLTLGLILAGSLLLL